VELEQEQKLESELSLARRRLAALADAVGRVVHMGSPVRTLEGPLADAAAALRDLQRLAAQREARP